MEVLILLIFVSSILVLCGLLFFVWSIRTGHHEHADRLALAPLRADGPAAGSALLDSDPDGKDAR